MAKIILEGSYVAEPQNAISIHPVDPVTELKISILIRRGSKRISLEKYANGIVNGSISNILSYDDFDNLFAPEQSSIDAVVKFAQENNLTIHKIYTNSATIKLVGKVIDFNQAFNISLVNITTNDRSYISYIGSLSIAADLQNIIIAILGLDNSITLERSNTISLAAGDPDTHLTPQQIATAYQFPDGDGDGVCVGLIELGGGYTQQNLTSSFSRIGLENPITADVLIGTATNNPTNDISTQEVMLNMYVVGGLAPKAKLAMYFAVNTFSGFINAVNAAIYDKTNGPSIISISWGAIDSAWGLNRNAMDSVLQSAVALGITVTVAAGNGGARATATSPVYTVQYPASSPYVLACGGTSLALNEDGTIASEVPWNNGYGASSGGVSTIYNLPSYQSNLQTTVYPNGSPIALSKRGVPDISAVADPLTGYQFYFGTSNTFQPNGGGTSAVAPMYAGLFARINQLTGKRIGFLNSIFYSNTSAFNDITIGNNAYLSPQGYSATIGWDAVTGLGSPIGTEIYKLLNTGTIYPDYTTGFRPTSGTVYPRIKTTIL